MWWTRAGFGRFVVVNELREGDCEAAAQQVHVMPAILSKVQISGSSRNTLTGLQKSVVFNLLDKGLGAPGTKAMVNLSWAQLYGPPVPGTWALDYEITAADGARAPVLGRIPLETPHGGRPMVKFTFRYAGRDEADAWYAVEVERFDWRANTWSSEPLHIIGDSPVASAGRDPTPTAAGSST